MVYFCIKGKEMIFVEEEEEKWYLCKEKHKEESPNAQTIIAHTQAQSQRPKTESPAAQSLRHVSICGVSEPPPRVSQGREPSRPPPSPSRGSVAHQRTDPAQTASARRA